ncbi:MAG: transporter substrate-binding domain-containing protein, partial [Kiloniellales bacterium]|nr:transporter substrate-binding domain-containing protein [Kiloniellales bacterium]
SSTLMIFLSIASVRAETIVVAVEDKDYSPYYTWADGLPQGPCPEIAAGAIRHMGAEVEFVRFPWVRVLKAVEEKRVDAGLCGTKTEERAAYSHYPTEALLTFDATLFVRSESAITSSESLDLVGKSFGLVKGYNYGGIDGDLEANGAIRVEAPNRDSLLKLLVIGRVDTVLDSILPLFADAKRMGVEDGIRAVLPSLDETPGYLFFSRKSGHKELAERFSSALKEYKNTPEFLAIKSRYGL